MDAREVAKERIRRSERALVALSHRIHAAPELGFEEVKACGWLTEALADAGFAVETPFCGLPTAFAARAGSGPLHVAVCAEYDALPALGHACGHNVIAAIALGVGLALRDVADALGLRVTVVGTPAEEMFGGKIILLERGAFTGVHVAMMSHPAACEEVTPNIIAARAFDVRYTGKAAHASAFPERGVNAADALTVAQTAIGLLRQQLRPTDRVHGIVTHGGDAPNVIPARTEARYMVRARTLDDLGEVEGRVRRCFEAGALASGATMEILNAERAYAHMVHDRELAAAYRRNAEAAGRVFPSDDDAAARVSASTDMGNVSLAVPSIHPMLGIDSLPAVNHQPEFAAACAGPAADRALVEGAVALAWTAVDLARDPGLRGRLLAADGAR